MDRKTFGQLVMDNEVQLYRIAKSILKNDEDCADAAQEAVLVCFHIRLFLSLFFLLVS